MALRLAVGLRKHQEAIAEHLLWHGMTMSLLRRTVYGMPFHEFVVRLRMAGDWIDAACVHALAVANDVGVFIYLARYGRDDSWADLAQSAAYD